MELFPITNEQLTSAVSLIANIATISGAIGIIIAYVSYRNAKISAKSQSINAIFRDYLRMDYDFQSGYDSNKINEDSKSRLRAYKMWVLEEIFLYKLDLDKERGNDEAVKNWECTIISHLYEEDDPKKAWHEFAKHKDCYSSKFFDFVRKEHPYAKKSDDDLVENQCHVCGSQFDQHKAEIAMDIIGC